MKQVVDIRTERTLAAPGVYAIDAEATVRDVETRELVYVNVNWYGDFKHYTVSKDSVVSFMERVSADWYEQSSLGGLVPSEEEPPAFTGELPESFSDFLSGEDYLESHDGEETEPDEDFPKFIEEYSRLSDTKQSEYGRVFEVLNRLVSLMSEIIE